MVVSETNPGSFVITLIDNSQIKVLYENKTNRLVLVSINLRTPKTLW